MKPVAIVLALILGLAIHRWAGTAEPVRPPGDRPNSTIEQARRQAEILHEAMHATLQVVHHRYYQEDEGLPLPAATLKEVFATMEQEQQVSLRWLAIEGQVMNTDHTARTDFEQAAAQALKAGKKSHEQIHEGQYSRVAPIILTNHCLKCHVPDRKNTDDRIAGLMITIPVQTP
ncbi:MAG: DUF3365 domain-containing protein [Planctomycetota bacterium]|nr:MAG: DUF3365 domain-containing protein [Planctomycetota bacterium]